MKRLGIIAVSALSLLALGCQQANNQDLTERLDAIDKKLSSIEEKIGKAGPPQRGAKRPQRPRPNPKDVYAVPIEGSAFKGAKHAKITVVEAFEFA